MIDGRHFTDDLVAAALAGRPLSVAEREYLLADLPTFEECDRELARELPNLSDPDLMRAACGVWADYVSGQL